MPKEIRQSIFVGRNTFLGFLRLRRSGPFMAGGGASNIDMEERQIRILKKGNVDLKTNMCQGIINGEIVFVHKLPEAIAALNELRTHPKLKDFADQALAKLFLTSVPNAATPPTPEAPTTTVDLEAGTRIATNLPIPPGARRPSQPPAVQTSTSSLSQDPLPPLPRTDSAPGRPAPPRHPDPAAAHPPDAATRIVSLEAPTRVVQMPTPPAATPTPAPTAPADQAAKIEQLVVQITDLRRQVSERDEALTRAKAETVRAMADLEAERRSAAAKLRSTEEAAKADKERALSNLRATVGQQLKDKDAALRRAQDELGLFLHVLASFLETAKSAPLDKLYKLLEETNAIAKVNGDEEVASAALYTSNRLSHRIEKLEKMES